MSGHGTETRAIPPCNRLAVRQAAPIVLTLICLLGALPVAGYFFARSEALEGVRRQTAQLADSVSHYDAYYRSWFAASVAPLIRIFETVGPDMPPVQTFGDTELGRRASHMLGQRDLIVRTVDEQGTYRVRIWSRLPGGETETAPEDGALTRERLEATLTAIGNGPGWHAPSADEAAQEKELRMRYSVPLRRESQGPAFGTLTLTVSMSWFEDRVKVFRALDGCAVFLLAPDGRWTLPEALQREGLAPGFSAKDERTLEGLRNAMRERASGSMSLGLDDNRFIAVFMPLSIKGFSLGVLIPRAKLLGELDTLTAMLCLVSVLLFCLAFFSLYRTSLRMLRPLVPLEALAKRLSRGDVGIAGPPRAPARPVYPDEPGRLVQAAERLRHALAERARDLTLLAVTRERLQGELRLARTIQEGLVPASLPDTEDFVVKALLEPTRDVSGDMYDCFLTDPDTLCCLMGNAAARGVPAALLMGRVMPLLRELLHSGLSPGKALENVNQVIAGYSPMPKAGESLFVSVFAGLFDRRSGRLLWASAGQRPPFATMGDPLPWSEDMPLGLRAHARYREQETLLPPGGLLFFCNERLLAAANPGGELFGEQQVRAVMSEWGNNPESLLFEMRSSLLAHCGGKAHEGLAMLALLRRSRSA